jgi:hypothetical protein
MGSLRSFETLVLTRDHGVTFQKKAFFIVTAVKTSGLTELFVFNEILPYEIKEPPVRLLRNCRQVMRGRDGKFGTQNSVLKGQGVSSDRMSRFWPY